MKTIVTRFSRVVLLVVVVALSVGACGSPWARDGGATAKSSSTTSGVSAASVGAVAPAAPGGPGGPNALGGPVRDDGIVAKGESSLEAAEARNVRLVRNGPGEVALQFELFNGTAGSVTASQWSDPTTRRFLLFDLPRGTSYQVLKETSDPGFKGTWGRLSGNWLNPIGPGQSITLTAVFGAPPAEASSMLVAMADLVPVQVPIQPVGAPALTADPILADSHNGSNSGPLVCASAKQGGPTSFRLPADVLFDFDRATLSPAAQVALDSLVKQINGTAGAVSVAGNTDAIGTDAYNQALSEQRAAAVAGALKQKLGGDFTFASVGNGKTKPVAPNTNPDGSDNPDGRAQNRRVDIEVTTTNPAPSTSVDPASNAVPSNVAASVQSVRRVGGFLLTTLRVSNPGPTPAAFAYNNTATPDSVKGGLFPGEVTVLDPAGTSRTSLCVPGGIPNTYFSYAASMNAYTSVPPGGSLTLWGITPAPATDTATVNVRIGGFPQPFPTPITPNS